MRIRVGFDSLLFLHTSLVSFHVTEILPSLRIRELIELHVNTGTTWPSLYLRTWRSQLIQIVLWIALMAVQMGHSL